MKIESVTLDFHGTTGECRQYHRLPTRSTIKINKKVVTIPRGGSGFPRIVTKEQFISPPGTATRAVMQEVYCFFDAEITTFRWVYASN